MSYTYFDCNICNNFKFSEVVLLFSNLVTLYRVSLLAKTASAKSINIFSFFCVLKQEVTDTLTLV